MKEYDKLGILLGDNSRLNLKLIDQKLKEYSNIISINTIDDKEYLLIPFYDYLINRDNSLNIFIASRYICYKVSNDNTVKKINLKHLFRIIKFDNTYSLMSIKYNDYFSIKEFNDDKSYDLIGRYLYNTGLKEELILAYHIGIFRDNKMLEDYIELINY